MFDFIIHAILEVFAIIFRMFFDTGFWLYELFVAPKVEREHTPIWSKILFSLLGSILIGGALFLLYLLFLQIG